MPWVRLHAVKDYTGMALLLEEFPRIRCTTNFSLVLLLQIEAYAAGETDTSIELLRNPAFPATRRRLGRESPNPKVSIPLRGVPRILCVLR